MENIFNKIQKEFILYGYSENTQYSYINHFLNMQQLIKTKIESGDFTELYKEDKKYK